MTDSEEKAEEYLRKGICQGCTFICEANCAYAEPVKQAYLDGLAEGMKAGWKEKWHDIRKNPDDLPKGDEDCLCFISGCYFVGHYVKEDKEWHFDEFISNGVIAWCEFPRFEE